MFQIYDRCGCFGNVVIISFENLTYDNLQVIILYQRYIFSIQLQSIILPHNAALTRTLSLEDLSISAIMDILIYIDLAMQLGTAIKKKHIFISKPYQIIIERFKDGYFLVDLLSAMPFDYVGMITAGLQSR